MSSLQPPPRQERRCGVPSVLPSLLPPSEGLLHHFESLLALYRCHFHSIVGLKGEDLGRLAEWRLELSPTRLEPSLQTEGDNNAYLKKIMCVLNRIISKTSLAQHLEHRYSINDSIMYYS